MAKESAASKDSQWLQALKASGKHVGRNLEPAHPEVEVYPDLRWAYNAFWRLSASRPEGMNGVTRIPVSEINAWSQLHRLPHEMSMELLTYVDAMDREYMAHLKERREEEEGKRRADAKRKAQNGQNPPGSPPRPPNHRPGVPQPGRKPSSPH